MIRDQKKLRSAELESISKVGSYETVKKNKIDLYAPTETHFMISYLANELSYVGICTARFRLYELGEER